MVLGAGVFPVAYPDIDPSLVKGFFEVGPILGQFKEMIEANHAQTRTVYLMPWAYEDGVDWGDGTRDSYGDMQLKIRDNTVHWADSLSIMLAPAGMAWYALLKDGQPQGYLHHEDGGHPNPRGSYLTAATILATLLGESVESAGFDGSLDPSDAMMLRRIASETVMDSRSLWNIPP